MKPSEKHESQDTESSDAPEKKGIDKFLLAIAVGAILLVAIVFIITLIKPKQDYLLEDTPEGVANNYIFALDQRDYPRAYSYLSPTIEGFPQNSEEFQNNVGDYPYQFDFDNITGLKFESAYSGEQKATVTVQKTTFSEGGIFGSNEYTRSFEMDLSLENGEWKITESESYFAWCWHHEDGCK